MSDNAPTILVVEDEAHVLRDVCEDLRENGYDPVAAEDGQKALEILSTRRPDLILCDIKMPNMDGYAFLKALRERHPDVADVPFFFLTSYGRREDRIRGRELGADDYVAKPIDFDDLYSRINAHLRQVRRIRGGYDARIAQARESLAALQDARGRLLRRAEEQIRGPAEEIAGASETLLSGMLGEIENAAQRRYLETIRRNAEALRATTPQIEAFSRFGQSDPEAVAPETCSLARALERAQDALAVHAAQRDVAPRIAADDVAVNCDPTHLDETLFHVLFCLIQISREGAGLTVRTERDEDLVGVAFDVSPIHAEAFGIEHRLEQAQSGDTAIADQNAFVLNLYAARALAERNGGLLEISSAERPEGASVHVSLLFPAAETDATGMDQAS